MRIGMLCGMHLGSRRFHPIGKPSTFALRGSSGQSHLRSSTVPKRTIVLISPSSIRVTIQAVRNQSEVYCLVGTTLRHSVFAFTNDVRIHSDPNERRLPRWKVRVFASYVVECQSPLFASSCAVVICCNLPPPLPVQPLIPDLSHY